MIILYCLLTTLNTNQIPLNKQLKTTQFWDREVRLIKKKKKTLAASWFKRYFAS
jgi:hypothetical protein